jgi:hypothetical protein
LQVFSKDHNWRALMESLNKLGDEFDGYKRLALIKYLQYLRARQELLRLIFAMTINDSSEQSTLARQSGVDFDANETLLFDLNQIGDSDPTENPLQQLPQGEAVRVHALPGHAIEIRVGKYPFKLMNADGLVLCDPHGRHYALSDGQNLVGRGSGCDIPLSKEFRNVSRRHLIAEPIDDHIILLTDISSHGTFAPPLHIERCSV